MSISPTQRRLLHWCGSLFALIGVIFVGFRLHSYSLELDLSQITLVVWVSIVALSIVYGSANFLLAKAWWNLLQHFSLSVSNMEALRIFGISQLAKYVPGNIFHLAGRQALGMAAGLTPGALAKSTFWELMLLAVAGAQFSWLILPLVMPYLPHSISVFFLFGSLTITFVAFRAMLSRLAAHAFLWQVFFMFISGAVFSALLLLISGGDGLTAWHWMTIGGGYIVAWLVGLVTPGAPAGVGVREFVLLLILKGVVVEADLLLAVLLGRLVTVIGDLSFYGYAYTIPVKTLKIENIDVAR